MPWQCVADLSPERSYYCLTRALEDSHPVKFLSYATWESNVQKWCAHVSRKEIVTGICAESDIAIIGALRLRHIIKALTMDQSSRPVIRAHGFTFPSRNIWCGYESLGLLTGRAPALIRMCIYIVPVGTSRFRSQLSISRPSLLRWFVSTFPSISTLHFHHGETSQQKADKKSAASP
jgi:hypothetical protein